MAILRKIYRISSDWEGKQYLILDLDWDYEKRKVHLSMLAYVYDALKRSNHEKTCKPQDQPYPHIKPFYRAKAQFSEQEEMSAILSQEEKSFFKKSLKCSSITFKR